MNTLSGTPFKTLLLLTVATFFSPVERLSSEELRLDPVIENTATDFSEDTPESGHGVMERLWGKPATDSLYLGMWSYHFVDDDEEYQSTHDLIGFTYKGIFAGTFENSRNERTWGIGAQRDIYRTTWRALSMETGYRLGILYGYDKMELFNSGLFPLFQLYNDIRYKNFGIQLSWGGSALTAGFLIRF